MVVLSPLRQFLFHYAGVPRAAVGNGVVVDVLFLVVKFSTLADA